MTRVKLCGMMRPEDIQAVNEIKPAHLGYWYSYEFAGMGAALGAGGWAWRLRTATLPAMEEDTT